MANISEQVLDNSLANSAFSTTDYVVFTIGVIVLLTWMCICIFFVKRLLKKFTYQGQGKDEENAKLKNPYLWETLGLPRGTFRGILTLTLLVVVIVLISMSLLVAQFRGQFETLVEAFEIMLAFYFGSKVMHHVTNSDKKKAQKKAEMSTRQNSSIENSQASNETDFEIENAIG